MKRFLNVMAVAVAALALTATAQAGERKGESKGESNGHRGSNFERGGSDYHTRFGTRFSHGYYYSGRDHNHWTYRYFWQQYNCDCYFCPSTSCWYYWCGTRGAYLPVSCINQAPPTQVAAAAAAAASSSNAVVAPTVVTNVIGSTPTPVPVPLPSDLPPPLPPVAPSNVKNTSIGSVGTVQPIGPSVPVPPGR